MSSPTPADDSDTEIETNQPPGIDAVKNAMGELLNNAEAQLNLPSGSGSAASARLSYQVHGTLSAQLDTDWEIFSGFTLTDVSLEVDAFYDAQGETSEQDFNSAQIPS